MVTKTGKKTGGRKAGTPNKTTIAVKEALQTVFNEIGGVAYFAKWATCEPTEFFKLYAKLLPTEVKAEHELKGELTTKVIVEFVDAK